MSDEPAVHEPTTPKPGPHPKATRHSMRRRAIGWGAAAAALSALLGVLANLSEIAGLFAPDETRDLVQETRVAVQDTDTKVSELLVLLRNQAAAAGLDLNIESETAIRNAIQAIVVSGNAQKQQALDYLAEGDVATAADMMAAVAGHQASAVAETGHAAAESWREAGALYFSLDVTKAINAYEEANRLEPRHPETLEMLGYALLRAGRLDDAEAKFIECQDLLPRPVVYASVYVGRAAIARQRGDYALANEYLSQALTTAESEGLAALRVHTLIGLASVAREQGDIERAHGYLQDGLQLSAGLRDETLRAKVLSNLGILEANREEYDAARRLIQEAHDIYVDKKDLAGQSVTIGNLGALALLSGALDEAESYLLRSVEIGERLGWRSSVAYDLSNLGGLARERQDYAGADAFLLQAEAIAKEVGLAELLPVIISNRGEVAFESGDVESACRFWSEAAPALARMGSAHAATVNQLANDAACPVVVGDHGEP